jgi:hypothetical protein
MDADTANADTANTEIDLSIELDGLTKRFGSTLAVDFC